MQKSDPTLMYGSTDDGRVREPQPAEHEKPVGRTVLWYQDARQAVPPSGQHVARQLARLCGEGSQVTIPWRSLADAVGIVDRAGRTRAPTEAGIRALERAGWLRVETVGRGRGARTTFYLIVGNFDAYGGPWPEWKDGDPADMPEWAR